MTPELVEKMNQKLKNGHSLDETLKTLGVSERSFYNHMEDKYVPTASSKIKLQLCEMIFNRERRYYIK